MRFCAADGSVLEIRKEDGTKRDHYIGRVIKERYQIIEKLGEGGMGTVYLAEQISIARKAALKLLQGTYASDAEFIERFRREARLAASLSHRNIITVYDFDQDDDGTLFIAMEYVNGRQLSEVIQSEGPLDIGRAVHLALQMAQGLEAAHRIGVIHRDIKPDNIMVVGSPGAEEVKLMDFGIARLRDSGTTSRLTRPDMIIGTPAYMAPEQAEGAEVSEKTDIYSFGIVLYEMLTGSVPFKASSPSAVLIKQIQEKPLPLRKIRRTVPAAIEGIVMRALEKKPPKRQQNIREVLQDLKKTERTVVCRRGGNPCRR
jgi:serine/threonine-protein kinase